MKKQRILDVALASRGDMRCLLPCLYSVVIQPAVRRITVYMTGEFPAFGDFYLEQLSALADMRGIEMRLIRAGRLTVRQVRTRMLKDADEKQLLWMIDDDVVLHPRASEGVRDVIAFLNNEVGFCKIAAITGQKPDVNNRRGYPDFCAEELPAKAIMNGSYNCLYAVEPVMCAPCYTCDTGNLVLNCGALDHAGIDFSPFEESANSGGEDTLFAMQCVDAQLSLWKTNAFLAYHLEKDAKPFSEFAARKEMLLRASESLGIANEDWKNEFMPFAKTTRTEK